MKPFFRTEQRLAKLIYVAGLWQNTPWMPNSEIRSVGVSCHNLPRSIYLDCGAIAPGFPKVIGDPTKSRHCKESQMVAFLDTRPEFVKLKSDEKPAAGDLLGIRIYGCIDHLGVALSADSFIHVLMHKKTSVDFYNIPPWQQHVEAIWRPVE